MSLRELWRVAYFDLISRSRIDVGSERSQGFVRLADRAKRRWLAAVDADVRNLHASRASSWKGVPS